MGRFRVSGAATAVVGCYLVVLAVTLLGAAAPPDMAGYSYPFASTLAGIDNLALPITTVLITQALQATVDRAALLRRVCQVTVAAMLVNPLVAFVSLRANLAELLSRFWESAQVANVGTDTVAGRSAQLGRISGVFNQPSEADVMYGAALLMAIYLYRDRPKRLAVGVVILAAGGVLTVSKIFVLVALPVAVWQIVQTGGRRAARLGGWAAPWSPRRPRASSG